MTTHDTDDPDAAGPASEPPERDVSTCYQAYLECNDHRPDSCTIYSELTAATARTRWIKADEDAFVSREEMR
ncbi:hypothetical protein D8Y22_01205 [Salinadaptatus halalkaliphilus]|uniref:DUF7511 domain-containing protein n=1 Tax=Salinadaptatus halalkaliphilus TaxID=2419781 RepID=A0A4S3TR27_9EURY|nr:hypothetical protein [Salinadaptatus halalkaliphilus]THE66766.1 hypothetical protein D8Y22_01205 [Salinadaptatus halalkaliphilus]